MIVTHSVNEDELAEAIATGGSYEEIVRMFLRIDEIQNDSAFTDLAFNAFMARYREIH